MKNSTKVIGLTCLLLGIPACLYADRAHDLAKLAAKQKAVSLLRGRHSQRRTRQTFDWGNRQLQTSTSGQL